MNTGLYAGVITDREQRLRLAFLLTGDPSLIQDRVSRNLAGCP